MEQKPVEEVPVVFLYDRLTFYKKKTGKKATVLITGSNTDFAIFLLAYGKLALELVEEVVCMGGAYGVRHHLPDPFFSLNHLFFLISFVSRLET